MNVTEIEKQSQATADNIAKIEENLDTLPSIEMDLISQYNDERKLRSKLNKNIDFIKVCIFIFLFYNMNIFRKGEIL